MKVLELRDIIRNTTSPTDAALIDWDPYGTTSSFYGPGAFLCWLLVAISYVTKWGVAGLALPGGLPGNMWLTSDFVAMLAYPLIAAGDAIIRAAALSPSERPRIMATLVAVRSGMNATTITPEVATDMDTLRSCVGLAAPLRVCEVFLLPGFMILVFLLCDERVPGKPRFRNPLLSADIACIITYLGLLVAIIVVAAVGTPGPVGTYWMDAFISQCMAYVIIAATPGMPIHAGWHLVDFWPFYPFPFRLELESLLFLFLGGFVVFIWLCLFITPAVIIGLYPTYVVFFLSLAIPDTGAGLGELDQAATVCVGVITLGITMYEVSNDIPAVAKFMRKCKMRLGLLREAREDEMPLTGELEGSQNNTEQPFVSEV